MRDTHTTPETAAPPADLIFAGSPQSARNGIRRSAALVYRHHKGRVAFLLVTTRKNPQRLVLPGGGIERREAPEVTAVRETREEAGVQSAVEQCIGRYLHRKTGGRELWTGVYLARFQSEHEAFEGRSVAWVAPDDLMRFNGRVCPAAARFIQHAGDMLNADDAQATPGIAA